MLLSMTGFGQASTTFDKKKITVEVKSLNGKVTDLRFKLPVAYKEKEITLRRLIMDLAIRGKLEGTITIDSEEGYDDNSINEHLFRKYHRQLSALKNDLSIDQSDLIQTILRIPNVIQPSSEDVSDEEWSCLETLVREAVENLNRFRQTEGEAMKEDLRSRIKSIGNHLSNIKDFESSRNEKMRTRLDQNIRENLGSENIDANRFEQEVLYYLEKLDINEEKVRLAQHLEYFEQVLDTPAKEKGRKLAFIGQEMGREINTLGAKAQNSNIQQLIVQMKDDLEKIKEQIANVV